MILPFVAVQTECTQMVPSTVPKICQASPHHIRLQLRLGRCLSRSGCCASAVDGGRINIATCSVGGAAFCLDHAREHTASRQQFGQPLDRFQHTQFKLADMATSLTASRLMVRCSGK